MAPFTCCPLKAQQWLPTCERLCVVRRAGTHLLGDPPGCYLSCRVIKLSSCTGLQLWEMTLHFCIVQGLWHCSCATSVVWKLGDFSSPFSPMLCCITALTASLWFHHHWWWKFREIFLICIHPCVVRNCFLCHSIHCSSSFKRIMKLALKRIAKNKNQQSQVELSQRKLGYHLAKSLSQLFLLSAHWSSDLIKFSAVWSTKYLWAQILCEDFMDLPRVLL